MPTQSVELVVVPELETSKELAVLNPESRLTLKQVFTPFFVELKVLEETASTVAVNKPKLARETRLAIRKVRIAAEKARVDAGANALLYKKSVDGIYGILEGRTSPLEKRLADIENAEELAIKAQAEALKVKRVTELSPFVDVTYYDLAHMPEMSYQSLLTQSKNAFDAKQAELAKAEADRKAAEDARLKREADLAAENKRLADEAAIKQKALDDAKKAADEAKRLADETAKKAEAEKARLKKEADDKLAAQALAAQQEAARVKKANDDKAAKERADRDASDRAAQATRTKAKADEDAKVKAAIDAANALAETAKKKADELAAQDKARKDREAADKAKADEAARKAAGASDAEKVKTLASQLAGFKCPTLTNKTLQAKIDDQLTKMGGWLHSEAKKL